MLQCVRLLATDKSKHISREAAARHDFTRVHFDPMESDRRSSFLFGRIFCDEPASSSPENALVFWIERLIPGRRSSNDRESRTQTKRTLGFRADASWPDREPSVRVGTLAGSETL